MKAELMNAAGNIITFEYPNIITVNRLLEHTILTGFGILPILTVIILFHCRFILNFGLVY